ncbi:Transferase [Corchorus olitorius]|uniref:Transferase n=1 Tax=Corchorus olitorius TaxID=93759 RepID=A0A1R3IFS2_9ROSI|nr:Transferase [Corchorus olitorius]
MKLEVEVVSRETVQPFSPTPDQLRSYQLSFLDQLMASIYNPWVIFYPGICDTEANIIKTSDQLKQSISKTLTYFYPLAGRITSDELFVDCNDEGIPFLQARVKCSLSDVIKNPVPSELNKLLPFDLYEDVGEFPMGIQFNIFECGGIGIGLCITHKIVDALSFFTVVNMWAAIARGDEKLVSPQFGSASLFPPRDLSGYKTVIPKPKDKLISKRFVFSASKIEEIRGNYSSLENQTRPTRVEALSAFIWSRFVAATEVKSRPDSFCFITHMVNLRTRIDPPLPEYSIGNFCSHAITIPPIDENGEICHNLVTQIRDSIQEFDKEFVKKFQDGYNRIDYMKEITTGYKEIIYLSFTSLCRFPIYETDFGWGRPIWAGSAARTIKNLVVFMDTVDGKGIEAWVYLKDEDMAKFESDEEILASIAPKSFKD